MLNNSFTKTNTIFGQALGCTALDDAFVKLLSDVNADGVTQFLVRTNGEEKMKTVAQINSESLEAGVRERIFDKVSPKYGTPTYWDTSTNIYFSINTFHPQKSLRGKVSVVRRMSKSCALCSLTLIATAKTHQLTSATASVNLYWMP